MPAGVLLGLPCSFSLLHKKPPHAVAWEDTFGSFEGHGALNSPSCLSVAKDSGNLPLKGMTYESLRAWQFRVRWFTRHSGAKGRGLGCVLT